MNSLFDSEKVNTGRQVEIDIAKTLSIIFMVFVHCLIVCEFFQYSLSNLYLIIAQYILGAHVQHQFSCSVWVLELFIQEKPFLV